MRVQEQRRRCREQERAGSQTAGVSELGTRLGALLGAGNRAVSRLLQRQPNASPLAPAWYEGMPGLDPKVGPVAEPAAPGGEAGSQEQAHHGRKPPEWFKMTSEQGALPGDPVPGISGPPYTEADRDRMRAALDDRLGENEPRADKLINEVP